MLSGDWSSDVCSSDLFHDKFVNIDGGDILSVAYQLNVAEAADITHTACTVKRVEDGREGRKGVGTRLHDLSHHVDLDSTDITQSQTDVGSRVGSIVQTVINLIQGALQIVVGGGDCHTAKVDKNTETHQFQAEVRQLLDIVINALYSDREIFVRGTSRAARC